MDIWPFSQTISSNSSPAAWPHPRTESYGPCLAYYRWNDEKDDTFWVDEMNRALQDVWNVALQEGCTSHDIPLYSNTSLNTTNPMDIYKSNYQQLRNTRLIYDPNDVMSNAA